MAPADINLSQTRRWLAQLHTTNLPPSSASSDSSMHRSSSGGGGGSADEGSSPTIPSSTSGTGIGSNSSSPTTTSPLTETRARSLQRLCEISSSGGKAAAGPASGSVNARFAPSNINYVKTEPPSCEWMAAAGGYGQRASSSVSPTATRMRGLSWARRKSSVQSLEELEESSMRRFSLSSFKLR